MNHTASSGHRDSRRGRFLAAVAVTMIAAGGVAAMTATGQGTGGSKATGTLEFVVEIDRAADARDDLRPKGDSAGDQVVTEDPVFDERNRTRIGRIMFLSTFQRGEAALLSGALRLRDGTITLAGGLVRGEGDLAVTGGTGAYAGARGTYSLENEPIDVRGEDGPSRHRATIVFTP